MFISVTFRILSFRTLPFIPKKKICIEFSANYPLTTFRIQSEKYPLSASKALDESPASPDVITASVCVAVWCPALFRATSLPWLAPG